MNADRWKPPHRTPWRHGPFRRPDSRVMRRTLFGRFIVFMFFFALPLVALGILLGSLLTGSQAGPPRMAFIIGVVCAFPLLVALVIGVVGALAFRSVGRPLANIMAAADAVAEGDLSARVEESGSGEFRRMARSFNRMTAELARADQQRRSLTADVAHELRTPLHILQGGLEGLQDGVYQPTPEHIAAMLDETHMLSRLVEDLQTLSLAEAGELALKMEAVDIPELLADVHTSFSGPAEAAGIALDLEVVGRAEDLTIQGDAARLDQVLSNLMGNALRHAPAGGAITLYAEAVPDGVRIMVSDTGEGIPEEDLPYIFDRFWRGDRSRKRDRRVGSGLGLAIANQIVLAHGGAISAESQVGQGTTLTIDLPRSFTPGV